MTCKTLNSDVFFLLFQDWSPKIAFLKSTGYSISYLIFSHPLSPQCVTVIWRDPAFSRRRASTSVRQTISVCMVHGATAVTASSQERWSPLWDARTIPSALSAVSAGTHAPLYNTHSTDKYSGTLLQWYKLYDGAESHKGNIRIILLCVFQTRNCYCPLVYEVHLRLMNFSMLS